MDTALCTVHCAVHWWVTVVLFTVHCTVQCVLWVDAAVQISLSLVISADSPRYFIIARTTATIIITTIINIPNYFS